MYIKFSLEARLVKGLGYKALVKKSSSYSCKEIGRRRSREHQIEPSL